MTLTFTYEEDALDCVMALVNAGRVYQFRRTISGEFEVTTTGE